MFGSPIYKHTNTIALKKNIWYGENENLFFSIRWNNRKSNFKVAIRVLKKNKFQFIYLIPQQPNHKQIFFIQWTFYNLSFFIKKMEKTRTKKNQKILVDRIFFFFKNCFSSSLGNEYTLTVCVLFNVQPLPSRDYTWLKSIASFLPGCCRTRFSTNEIFSYARAEIFCYCLQCGKGYFLAMMVGVLCGFQKMNRKHFVYLYRVNVKTLCKCQFC